MVASTSTLAQKKQDLPRHVIVASVILLVLAWSTSLDVLFTGFLSFPTVGITLGVQFLMVKLLARIMLKPALRSALLMLPAIVLATFIGLTCNAKARERSDFRIALGTRPPADMTDLHVFSSAFSDFVVFAFFRCSPESIRELVSNPIYQRREWISQYDFSTRDDWKDLRSLGLVTNMTVYARTNLGNRASGELRIDPEGRFVLVSYGVD